MPSKGGNRSAQSVGAPSAAVAGAAGGQLLADGQPAMAEANPFMAVPEDDPPVDTPRWAEMYERPAARYHERCERIQREQQEAQRLWEEFLRAQGEAVPEGDRSLVANDELHERLMRLAGTSAGHRYQRENVIGDPNQTFGIKIEFDGANPTEVARALYDAGLASSPRQESYHSRHRRPGMWTVETDATVTARSSARSCVTPQRRGFSWSASAESSAHTVLA